MKQRLIICLALALGLSGFFFTACDMAMGLGDTVDTTPPSITIESPVLNKSFGVIVLGESIPMNGVFADDTGVAALKVQINNDRSKRVYENGLKNFAINPDSKTWNANIVIPEPGEGGEAEYRVRVIAVDRFGNEGAAEVTIRVDVMAPWVERAWIIRHPNTAITQEKLKSKDGDEGYDKLIDFYDNFAYRNIPQNNRDDFQSNPFTLKLEVKSNLAEVAATRLYLLDENGNMLNSNGLPPSREPDNPRFPEWDINADILAETLEINKNDRSPHYIQFEVWAWNNFEWGENRPWDAEPPAPVPGEEERSVRKQKISGTCWYLEADRPRIVVNDKAAAGFVSLNADSGLHLSVFDDGKLKEIYAGLIPLEIYSEWRGMRSDADYYQSLLSDSVKRQQVIDWLEDLDLEKSANLFTHTDGSEDRDNLIELTAKTAGEYRLVALALDDKSVYNAPLPPEVWGVNTPLRVQILDANKPIIIVESPMENTFPTLHNNTDFILKGYTISQAETTMVQIGWVPEKSPALNDAQIWENFTDTRGRQDNPTGEAYKMDNGMYIWKLPVSEKIPYLLNEETYQRNNFEKTFDILTDFKVDGKIDNDYKLFYIYTENSGGYSIKTHRLRNYTETPAMEVIYPTRDLMVHNNTVDLTLKIKLTPKSVALDPLSIKITDLTGTGTPAENAAANEKYFEERPSPVLVNGEYQRTVKVTEELKASYFREGSRRIYRFEAKDILGNEVGAERTVIMSNLPAMLYITSSNAPGTYGQGTELRFEAVFSMPVKVKAAAGNKWPRLKLYFNDPGNGEPAIPEGVNMIGAYAEYVESPASDNKSNTVVFRYTVPDGVRADKLYTSLKPIVCEPSQMVSTEADEGAAKIDFFDHNDSLQERVEIGLDGIRPRIAGAAFTQITAPDGFVWPAGSSYFNKGKTVTLELTTTKQMRISGAPKAYLNIGSGTNVEAVFSSVTHNGSSSTLRFTYTVVADDVPETQAAWTVENGKWIAASDGSAMTPSSRDTITDTHGNLLVLPDEFPLSDDIYNGNSAGKRAFIITNKVPAPVFTLKNKSGVELLGNVKTNGPVTLTVNRNGASETSRISYSVDSGNNPVSITGLSAEIKEKDLLPNGNPNNLISSYRSSFYKVTAWQEDRAGNRSESAGIRDVEINSRAPELDQITCGEPNNAYREGSHLTFRLAFSRKVRAKTNGTTILFLQGTKTGFLDQVAITEDHPTPAANWDSVNSVFTFNYTVEPGKQLMDIKAASINLTGLEDEYGNTLPNYSGQAAETAAVRPINNNSSFNLRRDSTVNPETTGLMIDSKGPKIIWYDSANVAKSFPEKPTTEDMMNNGGLMTAEMNNTITFTFDKDVVAQSGKNIIVRPWAEWAVPPVMSTTDFKTLNNSSFYYVEGDSGFTGSYFTPNTADAGEYRRRLKWVDSNGLPDAPYSNGQGVVDYNYYIYTTKGLNETNGLANPAGTRVRPDVTGKYVLAFRHDIYQGVDRLRKVFNAAHWKWQVIPATSNRVKIINGAQVTVELDELEPGRIWEVIMDEGAFRDKAGNDSEAIKPAKPEGALTFAYRFWSSGTADPVIRVDRYSQGDHYKGNFNKDLNLYEGWGAENCPKIDTRIRIDCETPGASINFDTVRTSYTLNNPFGSNERNNTSFFNHFNVGKYDNTNTDPNYSSTGFRNNTFGNGGSNTTQKVIPRDEDGYFQSLLVPNTSLDVTADALETDNGAIRWNSLKAKADALKSGTDLNLPSTARVYKSSIESGFTSDFGKTPSVFIASEPSTNIEGLFFYAGDAYKDTAGTAGNFDDRNAMGDTDRRLFTGRRDYITAVAQKRAVNTGLYSGLKLDASEPSYEGVFKSTWIYRDPNATEGAASARTYSIILQGFDTPVVSKTPGFPLNEFTSSSSGGAVGNSVFQEAKSSFSKQAWRVGNYIDPTKMSGNQARYNNNYIWVSWDIVCDWYQKGRAWTGNDGASATGSMQRKQANANAVLSTYGGVTYRYRQNYTGAANGTTE